MLCIAPTVCKYFCRCVRLCACVCVCVYSSSNLVVVRVMKVKCMRYNNKLIETFTHTHSTQFFSILIKDTGEREKKPFYIQRDDESPHTTKRCIIIIRDDALSSLFFFFLDEINKSNIYLIYEKRFELNL